MTEEFHFDIDEFLALADEFSAPSGGAGEFMQVIIEPGVYASPPEWSDRKFFPLEAGGSAHVLIEEADAFLASMGTEDRLIGLRRALAFRITRLPNTQLHKEPKSWPTWDGTRDYAALDRRNPLTDLWTIDPAWEIMSGSLKTAVGGNTSLYRKPVWAHIVGVAHPWYVAGDESTHVPGVARKDEDTEEYTGGPRYLDQVAAVFETKEELLAYMRENGYNIWEGEASFDASAVGLPTSSPAWQKVSEDDWPASRDELIKIIQAAPNLVIAKNKLAGWELSDKDIENYYEVFGADAPF